jgi:hypothetical protein
MADTNEKRDAIDFSSISLTPTTPDESGEFYGDDPKWEGLSVQRFTLTGYLRNGDSSKLPSRKQLEARRDELLALPAMSARDREDLAIIEDALQQSNRKQ